MRCMAVAIAVAMLAGCSTPQARGSTQVALGAVTAVMAGSAAVGTGVELGAANDSGRVAVLGGGAVVLALASVALFIAGDGALAAAAPPEPASPIIYRDLK